MGDMAEVFNAMKKNAKEKRTSNSKWSTQFLIDNNIEFESKNGGAHLIVSTCKGFIDYWPSTGIFIPRFKSRKGRGVRNLIKLIDKTGVSND